MSNNLTLLNDLAQQINSAHVAASTAFKSGFESGLRAGQLLIEAKRHHKHGEWGDWIESNLTVSKRTAQVYMRLAQVVPKLSEEKAQRVAQMSFRDAIREVADRSATVSRLSAPMVEQVFKVDDQDLRRAIKQAGSQQQLQRHSEAEEDHRIEPVAQRVDQVIEREAAADAHIFDRMFGPLSGLDWARLTEIIRSGRRRGVPLPDEYLRLCAFHTVPIAELEAAE